ncbi:MAG: aspartate carbamoyltransferase catalytic subunit [Clostridia bacterium]|nr:aspartate carbamoyltransferase catalytic subunit [Clostridia bacterium]
MGLVHKDLLGLEELSKEEIGLILDTAEAMKEILGRDIKKVPTLRGRLVVNLFYEPSTRTRTSFELAAKYMGADVVNIAVATSSVVKGESLVDTAATLAAMGLDVLVVRHRAAGAPHLLARHLKASVINAGDGCHEHPSQALLDLYTIRARKGRLEGLKVAIIGDILHSRVARSDLWGLTKMGAEVRLCGPPTLLPQELARTGAKLVWQVEEALAGAEVVIALRLQLERQEQGLLPSLREYSRLWGLTTERLALAAPDVLLMHPGPVNRGVELDATVADGPWSAINEQVTNGVAVRMALLYLLLGEAGK